MQPNMQNDGNQKLPSRRAASGKGSDCESRVHRFSNAVGACNETRSAMDKPPSPKHEHLFIKWNHLIIAGETAWSVAGVLQVAPELRESEIVNSGPLFFAQFSDLLLGKQGVTGASLYQTAVVNGWDAVKGRRFAYK